MIEMHTCKIARRGKAAKGFVEVQTIGVPVLDDDGIARDFDYSELPKKYSESDMLDHIRLLGNSIIAMARGMDQTIKSESIRSQGESAMLVAKIMQEDLAMDKAEAKSVAAAITSSRSNLKKIGIDESMIPSIDSMLESRRKVVDKLKKDGKWNTAPRLVKKQVEEVDDTPSVEELEQELLEQEDNS
jgi:hypothetical protein